MFENHELCAACGGVCCKRMPGALMPEDVRGDLATVLKDKFRVGEWAIDWWEGDPRQEAIDPFEGPFDWKGRKSQAYFLRPAMVGADQLFHSAWKYDGICVYWSNGCLLQPDDRPFGCRWLMPGEEFCEYLPPSGIPNCKHEAALAWLEYEDVIMAVAREIQKEKDDRKERNERSASKIKGSRG